MPRPMSWVCRFSALSARWKASQPTSMKAPITPSQMNLLPLAISILAVVFEKPLAISTADSTTKASMATPRCL